MILALGHACVVCLCLSVTVQSINRGDEKTTTYTEDALSDNLLLYSVSALSDVKIVSTRVVLMHTTAEVNTML